jgi:hypothetical protein
LVRIARAAAIRCRIQREHAGHRGRTGDPLYGIRRLLRRAAAHHTDRSWARLLAGLDAGDTDDEQLARTWIVAHDLRLNFHCPDRARVEAHLYRWLTYCTDTDIPELTRLATTIDSWRTELRPISTPAGSPTDPPKPSNELLVSPGTSICTGPISVNTVSDILSPSRQAHTRRIRPRSEPPFP